MARKQKKKHSKNQFQSLIGSVMFLHRSVKPTRFFMNRFLHMLRNMDSNPVVVEDHIRSIYRHIPFSKHQSIGVHISALLFYQNCGFSLSLRRQ